MLNKILTTPTSQLGRAGRFATFQVKLWTQCARLLKKNRSGQRAAALSYHTLFGIVPLLIVMLMVFQMFPAYDNIGEKIKDYIYRESNLAQFKTTANEDTRTKEQVTVTERIDEIIDKFLAGTHKGSITLISGLLVIWAATALLSTIEKAFNNIWHVGRGRSFLHRIINYWSLLTLGPLLIGTGIYIATSFAILGNIQKTLLQNITPAISSYIIVTVIFFLLYYVLPNTSVRAASALWGAIIAAAVWTIAKHAFGYAVVEFRLYNTLYGALSLIPIAVLWIYITWQIVLFGLQLTFTTQHLKSLDSAEIASARQKEECFLANDMTIINMVREITAEFERNKAPVKTEVISSRLNMPGEFTERILEDLVRTGILIKSSEPAVGFVPAQDPQNIKLSQVREAASQSGFAQKVIDQPETINKIDSSVQEILGRYNLKEII